MGRFMKPDNISGNMANPQSWNLYSYVVGNPVNLNDPTGHWYMSHGALPGEGSSHPSFWSSGGGDGTTTYGTVSTSPLDHAKAIDSACWQADLEKRLADAARDTTGSNVVYDAHTGTAYVVSGGKVVGAYPMSHDNIAKGNLYLGNGTYAIKDRTTPYTHGDKKDKNGVKLDSQNGSYGPFGIVRLDYSYTTDPSHFGIGIHSGRDAFGGYCSMTAGCFRTTDEGMAAMSAASAWLPLNNFYVVNEPYDTHVVQQSGGF